MSEPFPVEVDHRLRVLIPNAAEKSVSDLIGATSQLLIAGVPTDARVYFEAAGNNNGGRDRILAVIAEWSTPPEPLPSRLQILAGRLGAAGRTLVDRAAALSRLNR